MVIWFIFFFSSRRRHTRCALVTGVQTCALPISTVGPIYRDSWLTWGAHIAGRYDMSVPAARAIARQLCGTTGGALAEGSARTIDIGLTWWALTALIAAGQRDAGVKGGGLVRQLVEDQPEAAKALYFSWYPDNGLTRPGAGE